MTEMHSRPKYSISDWHRRFILNLYDKVTHQFTHIQSVVTHDRCKQYPQRKSVLDQVLLTYGKYNVLYFLRVLELCL